MSEHFSDNCTEYEDLGHGVLRRWCLDGRVLVLKDNTAEVASGVRETTETIIEALIQYLPDAGEGEPISVMFDVSSVRLIDYYLPNRLRQFLKDVAKRGIHGRAAVVVPASELGRLMNVATTFTVMVGWDDVKTRVFTDESEAFVWLTEIL